MNKKIIIAIIIIALASIAFQTTYARRIRPFSSTPSSCQENEIGYNMTTHSILICTNSGYTALATGGSGGTAAPSSATYITQTPNANLSAEQALSALATGILKNTTTTGVLSIAVAGTDYENVLTFSSPLSRSVNTVSCPACGLTSGNLSQFAATTSAQLAEVLSDESGSGVSLFATLSSLTANDVLTWNGSNWINQAISGGSLGSGNINMTVANDAGTGTTTGLLAKLTGAPSTVRNTQTSDTENAIGVCTANCGTTGNATIAIAGQVSCQFDGSTTAGNYVVISATDAGKCHDVGSSFPTDKAAYGRVLTTNVGAGTYSMTLMTPDIAFQNAGNGKSKPGGSSLDYQYNNSGVFAGAGLKQEDANSVALRNGTNLQSFYVYNTFTNSSNYERLTFWWQANEAYIQTQGIGTGSQRRLNLDSADQMNFQIAGTTQWRIDASGDLLALTDNADDIGLASNRPRTIRAGTSVVSPSYTTTTNCTDSAGAAACSAAAAGSVVIDAAATSVVVSTTAVTANSQIFVEFDSSLGTRLSVTCNTTYAAPFITARTAGTSFTITVGSAPATNPACYSFFIVN